MYDVLICDDEQLQIEALKEELAEMDFGDEMRVHTFSNPQDLRMYISDESRPADVLLMDIVLDNGMQLPDDNGISIVSDIQKAGRNLPVIYISGYSEYLMDVYETEHCYFLLKPFDRERLRCAMEKALQLLKKRHSRFISLKTGSEIVNIVVDDICYMESQGRKVYVYTDDDEYGSYVSLNEMQDRLDEGFIRCHQSFIANIQRIQRLRKNELFVRRGNSIVSVPVSRSYSETVRMKFMRNLGDKL